VGHKPKPVTLAAFKTDKDARLQLLQTDPKRYKNLMDEWSNECLARVGVPAMWGMAGVLRWLNEFPADTLVSASTVAKRLEQVEVNGPPALPQAIVLPWSSLLWTIDPQTRLNVAQAAEAVGRSKSFIYHHTTSKNGECERLPFAKFDGAIVIEAGALRAWLQRHEASC